MIQKIATVILVAFLLQGCTVGSTGTWKNDHIDKITRAEIKSLDDKLFKALASNDAAAIREMMSPDLLKVAGTMDSFLHQVSVAFRNNSYVILDDYYSKSSGARITNTIPAAINDDNGYILRYVALQKESYVSIMVTNAAANNALVLAVYGKFDDGWKINVLRVGQYSLFEKNAPGYYQLARTAYEKSSLIDAYMNISLAEKLLQPANEFFTYQKDKEIRKFLGKVKNELNTSFPLPYTLEGLPTTPKIFSIYPQEGDKGFCPMIQYLTVVNLADTVALKAENEKVRKEVIHLFKGIDQDKKYIFFQAFNELPQEQKPVRHYGFIDQLTK